jgi:plastocyanin
MRRLIIIAFAVLSSAVAGGSSHHDAVAANVAVDMGNLYFCSASFQNAVCDTSITQGDSVTWENLGGLHTVTECDSTFSTCPPAGGGFDSGTVAVGGTFAQTFDTAGTFPYYCVFHPTQMRGRILVQAVETAAPTPAPATSEPVGTTAPQATSAANQATAAPGATIVATTAPGTGGGSGDLPVVGGPPEDTKPDPALYILLVGLGLSAGGGSALALAFARRRD